MKNELQVERWRLKKTLKIDWYNNVEVFEDNLHHCKEYTCRLLDIIHNKMRQISQDENDYEDLVYLIIPKLTKVLSIGMNEVNEIIDEIKIQYLNIDYSKVDAASEFIGNYSENKIIEIKNKKNFVK